MRPRPQTPYANTKRSGRDKPEPLDISGKYRVHLPGKDGMGALVIVADTLDEAHKKAVEAEARSEMPKDYFNGVPK